MRVSELTLVKRFDTTIMSDGGDEINNYACHDEDDADRKRKAFVMLCGDHIIASE